MLRIEPPLVDLLDSERISGTWSPLFLIFLLPLGDFDEDMGDLVEVPVDLGEGVAPNLELEVFRLGGVFCCCCDRGSGGSNDDNGVFSS